MFPKVRPRRLRANESIRSMVRETTLNVSNLIYPLFICEGDNVKNAVNSMPGIFQMSVDNIVKECVEIEKMGIPAVLFFGIPTHKDCCGSEAYNDDGIVQRALRAVKEHTKKLTLITDVCMCEYTDHGHCGIIENGDVNNDKTLDLLCREAVSHARAGADIVAPSDMMDGRVAAIREALDNEGFCNVSIMSYSVKYASCYYGPFREAAESAPQFGDRKTYQMDPANRLEALREVRLDESEGADIIIVKPAMAYLDVLREVKGITDLPVAAYSVSGEYSMIMGALKNGWVKEEIIMETLTSIKRAGADMIITYFAKYAAEKLKGR